jgi:Tfp pilus assembly protein PilF
MRFYFYLIVHLSVLLSACATTAPDTPQSRNRAASLELARQLVDQGEYQRAIQFLLPRSRSEDAFAEVHTLLGLSFLGINNPQAAARSFSSALQVDDNDDDARLNLGYTLIVMGKYQESRAVLNEIVSRKKYALMEKVHLNLGLSFLQEKNCIKAVPYFQSALDIDPTYAAPYFNLGKCQASSGRLADAKGSFQRAVDFCPNCLDPQLELASVLARLGEKRNAKLAVESILKAEPNGLLKKRAMSLQRQLSN